MIPEQTKYMVDLEEGEHVILEARRHPIVFYSRIVMLVILFFVPLFLSPFIVALFDKIAGDAQGKTLFGFVFTLWMVALWVGFFIQWTIYYLNVWVITNKRIFDINQKGLFTREITAFLLEKVQDITVDVDGMLATFLKYGTIRVETASESTNFDMETAANPVEIKNTIMRAHTALVGNVPAPTPATPTTSVASSL